MKKTISLVLVLAVGLIASVANADFTFGTPTNLGPTVNSSSNENDPCISADGLSLFFNSGRPGVYGGSDLWVSTRATKNADWSAPMNLGPEVNSPYYDLDPSISADGLLLYFMSDRPGGYGNYDLWITTRPTKDDPWQEPVNLGATVNSSYDESDPSISADGLSLFFSDYGNNHRPGGYGGGDLWVTTRATIEDAWGDPVNLGPLVNTGHDDYSPSISADGLALFFDSDRPGGSGDYDLWVTTRKTIDDNWGAPVNLGPNVNSAYLDRNVSISGDGSTLYFVSDRPGGYGGRDLWQAPIITIVDFNGDGIVNCADMCIMVDHWHTDDPLYDIAPLPFGDGIVDVQDLILLAEHLFEEIFPVELVAYWKLDETEGNIAYDSVDVNDGVVIGEAIWQPDAGKVKGTLQFDGIDDYVSTPLILNPTDGAFSVFAWIKGGTPGQVILSQTNGSGIGRSWLCTNPSDGKLMTRLTSPPGRSAAPPPLLSEFVVTDGNWHHIGFVWDGSYRYLYVDGTEVAKDTKFLTMLESADGGLHIGAGNTLEASSFFTGLIDDVRIYNRAVTP